MGYFLQNVFVLQVLFVLGSSGHKNSREVQPFSDCFHGGDPVAPGFIANKNEHTRSICP